MATVTPEEFERQLADVRLLPVLRAQDAETAVQLGLRLHRVGLSLVEVSWTTPRAAEAVRRLRAVHPVVGAGTVLTAAMAEEAVNAGAAFLVAPTYSPEVAALARERATAYLPAAYTPQEVYRVLDAGWRCIKLFPASTGGMAHMKAMQEVFPSVRFVPTGGITVAAAADWVRAGALAVGVGGALHRLSEEELAGQLAALHEETGVDA
jgi:2-dehydro-3-deoxyphosphogluconate aldolase/(4S)-4-hydroxy-2-oxoglutarate aldolase